MTSRADGSEFSAPIFLPFGSGKILLQDILEMPQTPLVLSLDAAFEAFTEYTYQLSSEPQTTRESMLHLHNHWVQWVASRGFCIRLDASDYRDYNKEA